MEYFGDNGDFQNSEISTAAVFLRKKHAIFCHLAVLSAFTSFLALPSSTTQLQISDSLEISSLVDISFYDRIVQRHASALHSTDIICFSVVCARYHLERVLNLIRIWHLKHRLHTGEQLWNVCESSFLDFAKMGPLNASIVFVVTYCLHFAAAVYYCQSNEFHATCCACFKAN